MENNKPQLKSRAALLSVSSNTLLVVFKLIAGLLTGSVAILSDAIHSFVDLGASVVALLAVHRSGVPPDSDHRYGHNKFEDLSASIEALLLLLGAAVIAEQAIGRFIHGGHVGLFGVGLTIVGAAAVINLFVSHYLKQVANRTSSAALAADSAHLSTDAIASIGVFISLLLIKLTGAQWIDPAFGLLIASVITVTGLKILFGSGRRLIDTALPDEEMVLIDKVINSFIDRHNLVLSHHDVRARQSGLDHEVDFHLQFGTVSLAEAHRLTHILQDEIVSALPRTTVLIHMEPSESIRPDSFVEEN